jgi:hypothetical protein
MATTKKLSKKQLELQDLFRKAQEIAPTKRTKFDKKHIPLAIDWGDYRKGKLVGYDGKECTTFNMPLDELIPELAACGVTSFAAEGSFSSFNLKEKMRALDAAKRCDVAVNVIPSKQTERYRRTQLGFGDKDKEKSEEIDALCIYEIANYQPCHVAIAQYPSTEQIAKQENRNSTPAGRALVLRSLGWPEEDSKEFTKYLPKVVEPWIKNSAFYDEEEQCLKLGWCAPIIAAALEVIEQGGGRTQFDRKIGYHGFGYPSFLRSNFYYWLVGYNVKRRFCEILEQPYKGISGLIKQQDPDLVRRIRNEESKLHRRVCRWLYGRVRNHKLLPSSV